MIYYHKGVEVIIMAKIFNWTKGINQEELKIVIETLNDDGIIIFETAKETVLDEKYGDFILYKEKRYGITRLNYFKRCI